MAQAPAAAGGWRGVTVPVGNGRQICRAPPARQLPPRDNLYVTLLPTAMIMLWEMGLSGFVIPYTVNGAQCA